MKIAMILAAVVLAQSAGLALAQAASRAVVFGGHPDGGLTVQVQLADAVPYRVFTLENPRRLVLDFQDIPGFDIQIGAGAAVAAVRTGRFQAGWTRIIADLEQPLAIRSSALTSDHNKTLQNVEIKLEPVSAAEYSRRSVPPPADEIARQRAAAETGPARRSGEGVALIALDPGHGGIDPGANRDGAAEKSIVLEFGLELRRQLDMSGRYQVVMTREEDDFVSLNDRVARAREANALVLVSIHVNTVTKGKASGAAVYILGAAGDDSEADATAAMENSADIVSGLAADGTETDIIRVLTGLARTETNARSALLAQHLLEGLRGSVGVIGSRPSRAAEFRVLQAPDVPSVLLELGFLSDAADRADLMSPQWRRQAAIGIVQALDAWVAADAEAARLARQ